MAKFLIEFELPETTTPYRKFTKDAGKLLMTLREAIEEEDGEAREWLYTNVLDISGTSTEEENT